MRLLCAKRCPCARECLRGMPREEEKNILPVGEAGGEAERSKSEVHDTGIKPSAQGDWRTEQHDPWDVLAEKPLGVPAALPGCWMSSAPPVQLQAAEVMRELATWGWDLMPSAG